ncbi:MAG TPA: metallophosphoesterase [Candidatus Limnocylindrales bacterium]|jgi:hypothetical protein|nr:metallophosphoesterase [Candidatus Limnocylindrales bacterium]
MHLTRTWGGILLFFAANLRAANLDAAGLTNIPSSEAFTFAVLGDNRGDDSGDQPPAFRQVLQAVDHAAPAFVLDSGDMIYGHTPDEARVRDQWRRYREAIMPLHAAMFHVPGNHDLWDEPSARIYQELWGKTYYAFDFGNSRFIGLDTETANGRLGEEQLRWLEQQFDFLTQTNVFVFLHRPLFPVDGGIGSSLDKFPAERDRAHALFVRNRKRIRGVFAGHEHLYNFQERDGVRYYISGGGGAPLYTAPELGGFHHFLLVRVQGDQVEITLNKISAPVRALQPPRRIAPGESLESWTQGLFWYAWDRTANIELTPDIASAGRRALRLNFDLAQYAWPVLALSLASPLNFTPFQAFSLDLYLPTNSGSFVVTPAIQGTTKHEAPPVHVNPGWNTIKTELDAAWLPSAERSNVTAVEWSLSGEGNSSQGYAVFDNLRASRRRTNAEPATELLESWERPLLWRVFDETVHAEIVPAKGLGEHGLRLHLNFAEGNQPVLFARLNPPWDLSAVKALVLLLDEPGVDANLTIDLSLRAKEVDFTSPSVQIRRGTQQLRLDVTSGWLPQKALAAVDQIGFNVRCNSTNWTGTLTFERLDAASR